MHRTVKSKSPKINWRQIGEELEFYSWTEKDEWVSTLMDREFAEIRKPLSPVTLKATLNTSGKNLLFQGEIHLQFHPQCDRCGKEFRYPMKENFRILLFPASPEAEREGDDSFEDVDSSILTGEEVDLSVYFLEQTLLLLPMKFLCRPDCPGLCLRCGADLATTTCKCKKDQEMERREAVWGKLKDFKI